MARAIKNRNGNTMTEAAFYGKLRSVLRRGFMWWIPMQQALTAARRPSQSANKRLKYEYQCAHCKKWFARKDIQIDHIIPCGSLLSLEDLPRFVANLTQEDSASYQVLCKKHHKDKTLSE